MRTRLVFRNAAAGVLTLRSPDEYPFTSNLPEPVLKSVDFPKILYSNTVNANPSILSFYTRQIVPRITKTATVQLAASKRAKGIIGDDEYEDDGNYGSAATLDVEVLQAISKRVHYGTSAQLFPEEHGFRKADPSYDCVSSTAYVLVNITLDPAISFIPFSQTREIRLRVQVPLGPCCVRPAHSDAEPGRPRRAYHETGGGEEVVAETA